MSVLHITILVKLTVTTLLFLTHKRSGLVMTMVTVCEKFTATPWRVSGLGYATSYVPFAAFTRNIWHFMWLCFS